ncbi:hypothetical protein ACTFIY_004561 [Dictyostelium cf. discoideum]
MNSLTLTSGTLLLLGYYLFTIINQNPNDQSSSEKRLDNFKNSESIISRVSPVNSQIDSKTNFTNSDWYKHRNQLNQKIFSFGREINGLGKFMDIQPNISFADIEQMWLSSFTLKRASGDLPSLVFLSFGGEVNPNGIQLYDITSPTLSTDLVISGQYAPIILNASGNPLSNRTHVYLTEKVDFSKLPERGVLHRLRVFIRNKDGSQITGPYNVEMVLEYTIKREQFFSNNH